MRAFKHVGYYPKQLSYVKGGSLNQGHSQGLGGVFGVASGGETTARMSSRVSSGVCISGITISIPI